MLPRMQVDKGAIRFVLSGANIMCPGLTSPGAKMTRLDAERVVAVMAEGKEHAVAVGLTKMSSDEMQVYIFLYLLKTLIHVAAKVAKQWKHFVNVNSKYSSE